MAGKKFDGVIEAVRYAPDGRIGTVRVYERHGPVFTDRVLLTRETLIERLKAGKVFVAGRRKEYLASTFDVFSRVRLVQSDGQEIVASENETVDHDLLKDVPVF